MISEFREYLNTELIRRQERNPSYSKRAFAKDIGISKSSLHDLLSGKRGLSKKSILTVSEKLGITEKELESFQSTIDRDLVDETNFSRMCHWYHFAMLGLFEFEGASADPKWIASHLNITPDQAADALKVLCDLQIIRIEGQKIIRQKKPLKTTMDFPSRSLKTFHAENLDRAEKSLFQTPIEEREFTSLTGAINDSQFKQIKKETEKFRNRLSKILSQKSNPTRIYTIATQVFPQSNQTETNHDD